MRVIPHEIRGEERHVISHCASTGDWLCTGNPQEKHSCENSGQKRLWRLQEYLPRFDLIRPNSTQIRLSTLSRPHSDSLSRRAVVELRVENDTLRDSTRRKSNCPTLMPTVQVSMTTRSRDSTRQQPHLKQNGASDLHLSSLRLHAGRSLRRDAILVLTN